MEDICRLCCSTNFVNNDIFAEENALYIKMSLYLPIKVFKNDRLPQKVCDRCSCKVNDFYQFCNETIEVQNRLRAIFLPSESTEEVPVEYTVVKDDVKVPVPATAPCEQATQTDGDRALCHAPNPDIKQEPVPSPAQVKNETTYESDHSIDNRSDTSEDMSLITLKQRKNTKQEVNGVDKKPKKKKGKLKDWEMLMKALPEGTAISLVDKTNVSVKEEMKDEVQELIPVDIKKVKSEVNVGDVFYCCVCLAQCYSRTEMRQHYRSHKEPSCAVREPTPPPPPPGDGPTKCTRCGKVVSREGWSSHWQRHWARDRRPYRCALCEKSFRDHHQILKHGLTHAAPGSTGSQPAGMAAGVEGAAAGVAAARDSTRFVCDFCPERFVYMRFLLAHRTRAHPEGAGRPLALRCGTCARTFAHLNSLRRHLRSHSGERNYLCNVCGKALTSREHLKFHIRIHTGYKPNVCKTCGKGFVKKCNLTLHERVHSGEKPHVCSHCGKAFSQRSTLVIHERYHSGARPYECGLCGRGFVAKGLLSMHLKTTCI